MSSTYFSISSSSEMANELSLLPFCGVFFLQFFLQMMGEGNWHSAWHVHVSVLQNKIVFIVMTIISFIIW